MSIDKVTGFLEVGCNEKFEVVVNHPDLKPDENGVGHIVFSPAQARSFGNLMLKHAAQAEGDERAHLEAEKRKAAEAIPVDRSARVLVSGMPVSDDHREINPATGQQRDYVVLSAEERAKGFVRPVRCSYVHKTCGTLTTMSLAIAETYARDPAFYVGTFCSNCRQHRPLIEFVWSGTGEQVGS